MKPVHQVAAPVVDEDMTIIHDRAHPKYSAEAEEAFAARMQAMAATDEKDTTDNREAMSVSYSETNNTDQSEAGLASWQSSAHTHYTSGGSGGAQDNYSAQFPLNSDSQVALVKQPGCADVKQNALGVDLSRLSTNTLKLLGRAATVLSRSNLPVSASLSDELQLTAIVDRLNQAAAKNKRSHDNSADNSASSGQSSNNSREGECLSDSLGGPVMFGVKTCHIILIILIGSMC